MALFNDIVTRFYWDAWRDVSDDLLYDRGVDIQRGKRSEDGKAPPQESEFKLKNHAEPGKVAGRYTERNPLGPWFFQLGRNNPHEQSLRLAKDTGTGTVVDGWGSTEAHANGAWDVLAWTNSGGADDDYQRTGGKLTHIIDTADSGRRSQLLDFDQREFDVTYSLSLSFSDVQVGAIGTDLGFRVQDGSTYYMARLLIATDETVKLAVYDGSGNAVQDLTTVTGITHTSAQALHFRVQGEGSTFRAKVWHGADRETTEPYEWTLDFTDVSGFNTDLLDASGSLFIQSFVGAGNTNVPITFSYDNVDIRMPLVFDYISEWPQNRDETGAYQTVEVTGAGMRRRLMQEKKTAISVARSYIRTNVFDASQGVKHYWPLEDSEFVVAGEPEVGDVPLWLTTGQDTANSFSKGDLAPWLGPAVKLHGVDSLDTLEPLSLTGFVAADGWMVDHVRKGAWSNDYQLRMKYGSTEITCVFEHSIDEIDVTTPAGSTTTTYVPAFDGGMHHIRFTANGSGTVTWAVYVDGVFVMGSTYAGTLGALSEISIDDFVAHTNEFSVGHVAIYDADFISSVNAWDAVFGFNSEKALHRMERVAGDADIPLAWIGDQNETAAMGPQQLETAMDILEECEFVDDGLLYEQRTAPSLVYRSLNSMLGRDSWCTLSMSANEISPPWKPTRDDRNVVNKVIAKRTDGGEYGYQLAAGRMSTEAPENGGIGVYEQKIELGVDYDSALSDQASWRVTRGTVDEYRYPSVTVELHRTEIWQDNPELYRRLIELDVGDQITLADMGSSFVFDDTPQLVVGYSRYLDQFRHVLVIVFAPASPLRSGVLDDAEAYIDAETSVVDRTMATSSDTSFAVRSSSETWTTSVGAGVPIMLEGEEMLATAIGAAGGTLVSVGTATHGDNASVTPGTPAGSLVGDVMLIHAAIRESDGSANPDPPDPNDGWVTVVDNSNSRLFGKYVETNGEAPPEITFTGGAAGDTTSAQAAILRGVSLTTYDTESQLNSSAQDIAVTPPLTPPGAPTMVVTFAWKQDDWTSVATLTGMTEIAEATTTTGNDQSIVWDYQVCDGVTTGPTATSWAVTGGASAVSRSGSAVFHATQAFTVTRGTNGVSGLVHEAGTAVNVARPLTVGLS